MREVAFASIKGCVSADSSDCALTSASYSRPDLSARANGSAAASSAAAVPSAWSVHQAAFRATTEQRHAVRDAARRLEFRKGILGSRVQLLEYQLLGDLSQLSGRRALWGSSPGERSTRFMHF